MSVTVPGLVDLQVNGGFGHDFTSDPGSIWEVGRRLPEHGVTAFVPTIVSSSPAVALAALAALTAGPPIGWTGARPVGIHLEGPMISNKRRGAHPDDLLVAPSLQLAESWIHAGPPLMVTLAPELTGAQGVITALREAGTVVSLGHSDCTAGQARAGIGWGAAHVTHLFNAMSGLDHRRPGLAAAALTDDSVTVGLIADGIHVDPVMMHLAFKALGPDRIALVTDAVAALGGGRGSLPPRPDRVRRRRLDGARCPRHPRRRVDADERSGPNRDRRHRMQRGRRAHDGFNHPFQSRRLHPAPG